MKKIGSIIVNCLFVIVCIILIIFIYSLVSTKVLHKSYVNLFGYTYFEVLTGSMEDTINVSDFVFVKIGSDYEEGDIVSYILDDDVITHRVVSITDDEVITKGDNNNTFDEAISSSQVIGKVVYIGKEYGIYLKVIKTPIVFISFILTVILFYFLFKKEV